MGLSDGIRKIGFRRWYERQLIESHLYLISGFMCLIAVAASFEDFSFRTPGWETLVRFAAILGGSVVCLWAVRRYMEMLGFAEYAAERSVCERCGTYRGLEWCGATTRAARQGAKEGASAEYVEVRCRKCGHQWTIDW